MLLLSKTDLDVHIVNKLQAFNIRNVEQLLLVPRESDRAKAISTALAVSLPEFNAILEDFERKYKELIPKRVSFKPRALGYRVASKTG